MEGALDDQAERASVDRLLIEVPGTLRDRRPGIGPILAARNHDHLGGRRHRHDLLQERQADGGAGRRRRQAEIERHDRRSVGAHQA